MITLLQPLYLRSSLKTASGIKLDCTMTLVLVAEIGGELSRKYRPYLLLNKETEKDWILELDLDTVERISKENLEEGGGLLKILMLYGSLRERYVRGYLSEKDCGGCGVLMESGGHIRGSWGAKLVEYCIA